jgi:hypothetical protein
MTPALHFVAEDAADLGAFSALLQDAVVKVGDIAFLPKARRFVLILNRYRWEEAGARGRGRRVRSALRVEGVTGARVAHVDQEAKEVVLSLLAMTFEPDGVCGGSLSLRFSGGATIALSVEALEMHLDDVTVPWTARGRPTHDI